MIRDLFGKLVRKQASTPARLHAAHLGRNFSGRLSTPGEASRIDGELLARRYGQWVHRCVTMNSAAAASVPIRLFARSVSSMTRKHMVGARPIDKKTVEFIEEGEWPSGNFAKASIGRNIDQLVEIEQHPILDLLRDVNPWTDGFAYRESLFSDMQIFGEAFTLLVGEGSIDELWRIMPQRVKVIPDPTDFVAYYEVSEGQNSVQYDTDSVVWFRTYDPSDPWGAVGPLEAWLKTIDASFAMTEFIDWVFKRGGAPEFVVTTQRGMGEDQKHAFRTAWKRLFGRLFSRQETVAFLEGDARLEKIGQTNRELDYTQSEDQKRDQIGQAFGVPKSLLTADDVNRSNARESREQHFRNLWSLIQRVEDTLNQRLVTRFGQNLILIHDNPVPEDRELTIADRESKLRSGWSINEVRIDAGEPPFDEPEASEPMVRVDVAPLKRAGRGTAPINPADFVALIAGVSRGEVPPESARTYLMSMGLEQADADAMVPDRPAPILPVVENDDESETDRDDDSSETRQAETVEVPEPAIEAKRPTSVPLLKASPAAAILASRAIEHMESEDEDRGHEKASSPNIQFVELPPAPESWTVSTNETSDQAKDIGPGLTSASSAQVAAQALRMLEVDGHRTPAPQPVSSEQSNHKSRATEEIVDDEPETKDDSLELTSASGAQVAAQALRLIELEVEAKDADKSQPVKVEEPARPKPPEHNPLKPNGATSIIASEALSELRALSQ